MIKSVSGTLSVKTEKFNSKITIPAKLPVDNQIKDLLQFVGSVLKENGDYRTVCRFIDDLAVIAEEIKI